MAGGIRVLESADAAKISEGTAQKNLRLPNTVTTRGALVRLERRPTASRNGRSAKPCPVLEWDSPAHTHP